MPRLVSTRIAQLGLAAKQAGLGASFSLKQRSTARVDWLEKWKSNVTVSLHDAKHTGLDIAEPLESARSSRPASFTSIYETWH